MDDKHAKLRADLAPVLMDGEQVEDLTTGVIEFGFSGRLGRPERQSGIVAVTNSRVICFAGRIDRYDVKDFNFGVLTSVDNSRGWLNGELHLTAASGESVHVFNIAKKDADRIAQAIRTRMALTQQTGRASTRETQPSQLEMLHQLRDAGVLTEEEFQRKRKQIREP